MSKKSELTKFYLDEAPVFHLVQTKALRAKTGSNLYSFPLRIQESKQRSILWALGNLFLTTLQDVTATKGHSFEDYFLKRELLMGIYEKGFEAPSPIQEESIPIALMGTDLSIFFCEFFSDLTSSSSRSGYPRSRKEWNRQDCIIHDSHFGEDWPHPQHYSRWQTPHRSKSPKLILILILALILVPTRELALQTAATCKELGKHMGVQVMVTTGGTPLTDDIIRLHQPVHVVIGTPGR